LANPQKQNGYVPIANELLEAIYKTDMTRNELRVLLCVIRYTYGYNAKSERLSLGFISSETGLAKSRVSEALNGLKGKNITIVGEWQSKEPREIAIQKDYEKWFRVT
jgi:phage replication O-like protein O